MRKVLKAVAMVGLLAVPVGVYLLRFNTESDRIKLEVLRVVDGAYLSDEEKGDFGRWVEAAHKPAFSESLNATARHSEKFDADHYWSQLQTTVLSMAREEGQTELADRIAKIFGGLVFGFGDD